MVHLILAGAAFALAAEPEIGAYDYPWYYKERWTNEPVADTRRVVQRNWKLEQTPASKEGATLAFPPFSLAVVRFEP